jgi:hypothetical protein
LPEGLPSLALPNVPLTLETLRIILPYSLTMAAVGLLESLLTAQIVDDMTDTESDKRRECMGQGGANIAAALVGGMGGCAMIGQSVINVTSGGRGRLSTFVGRRDSCCSCWRCSGPSSAGSHARSGRGDDHGFDRHVQLELDRQSAPPSADLVDRDAGDGGGRRRDARSGTRRAGGRTALGHLLAGKVRKMFAVERVALARRRTAPTVVPGRSSSPRSIASPVPSAPRSPQRMS